MKNRAHGGTCGRVLLVLAAAVAAATPGAVASGGHDRARDHWIGTWATASQPALPGRVQSFKNQSARLIVHTSAGGRRARIRISNTYGDAPLPIGGAHIARRTTGAGIDPTSDRALTFGGQSSTSVPARTLAVSDPVDLDVPALSDLAITLFFPEAAAATTSHALARQTSYVSSEGDFTASAEFPVSTTIRSWPFLTGVDVSTSSHGATIVAFGSSLTDGDGSTLDANRRWPDVLAERLQKAGGGKAALGVLNLGIIGNRLLYDSPRQPDSPFGAALGESGLARFERDVLSQASVKWVLVGLGINDIAFPAFPFTPPSEKVQAKDIVAGYRRLIASAHRKGVRVIGTIVPPFENSVFEAPPFRGLTFYTPEREAVRQEVNAWILRAGAFDAVVDFDAALRDPNHPTQLRPDFDSGDHLHPNDAGYGRQGERDSSLVVRPPLGAIAQGRIPFCTAQGWTSTAKRPALTAGSSLASVLASSTEETL
jgi:lysophospholipase L1-like esterase